MRSHESNLPFGGPAFPFVFDDSDAMQRNVYTGMTLRDYFAGICLPRAMKLTDKVRTYGTGDPLATEAELWVARAAYKMADAMLKAREE
jgi:hypothetical protein